MATEPVQDGQTDFSGGQNASQIPAHVGENQYYSGVNVSCEKGSLNPRWGSQQKTLTFDITEEFTLPTGLTRSYESIFLTGRYQAIIPYLVGTEFYLICVVSGVIFFVNQQTFVVTYVPIADGSYIDEDHFRVNWTPAGARVEIFDFPSYPVIIDGVTARRADPALLETPVSVLGTYNQNRVAFSNAGNEWTASDPAAFGFPNGPISCTELLTPASPFYGQVFQLSTNYNNNPITAMGFLQVVDTSTGIGPLLVATQDSIWSYHTELPRAQWEATQFGSVFISSAGIVGQRALCNVNSDIFFISKDGQLRSASMSREEQGKWSKTPISREVQDFIVVNDKALLKYSVVSYYRNKIIMTVNPYKVKMAKTDLEPSYDVAFGGFVVLELDNVSTLGKDSQPAWAGMWCPFRPMDFVINNDRMFAVAKEGGINTIYEMRPDLTYDKIGVKQEVRKVKSKIYTKEFEFKAPFNLKTLNSLDFNLQDVRGNFTLKVKYKPSHANNYIEWRNFSHIAPWRICQGVPIGCEWNGLAPHSFRELNLGSPINPGCNPVTKDKYDTLRMVQLLFEIEGVDWLIESFVINGQLLPQNTTEAICKAYPIVKVCEECNNVWEIPTICQESQEISF